MAEAAEIVPSLMNLTVQPVQPVQPVQRRNRQRPRHWNKKEVREKREYWNQVHATVNDVVESEIQPEAVDESEPLAEIQREAVDESEPLAEIQPEAVEESEPLAEIQPEPEVPPVPVGDEATMGHLVEIGVANLKVLSMIYGESLSKKMNWVLRWGMPEIGLPYSEEDGSTSVSVLAKYLGVSEVKVEMATDPTYGRGKQRMVLLVTGENSEKRIASTGGHSFKVRNPPGHSKISEDRAKEMKFLVHETDSKSIDSIRKSGSLKDVKREGGINFTVQKRGGYKKKATHEVHVDIVKAIQKGYSFFENEFTGIVYGQGVWQGSWWSG